MKRLFVFLLSFVALFSFADDKVTVNSTNSDISENLDLRVVATLFANSKNLETFEKELNDSEQTVNNLDLNGDGEVDYLRVIEVGEGNQRLIILQAVLAKDIYQDVASIVVEKDPKTNKTSMQVVGDEYVYGVNYVIEPVFYYRPVIYDWFWSPAWVCWHSPYYWGYYPHYWRPWHCHTSVYYRDYCWHYHRDHHYCSFRYARSPRPTYSSMRSSSPASRRDYAVAHPNRSFSSRNSGSMTSMRGSAASNRSEYNARALENNRRAYYQSNGGSSRTSSSVSSRSNGGASYVPSSSSRTYNSSYTSGSRTSAAGSAASNRSYSSVTRPTSTSSSVSTGSSSRTSSVSYTPSRTSTSNTSTSRTSGVSYTPSRSNTSGTSSSRSFSSGSSRTSSPSYTPSPSSSSSRTSMGSSSGSSSRTSSGSSGGGSRTSSSSSRSSSSSTRR